MRNRNYFLLAFMLVATVLFAADTMPIKNGKLTTNLDANSKDITAINKININGGASNNITGDVSISGALNQRSTSVAAGKYAGYNAQTNLIAMTVTNGIHGVVSDGGAVIVAGAKGWCQAPYAGTITDVTLLSAVSGSIVIDIYKCTYSQWDGGATHPVSGDKITASAPPTLTTATKSTDSTLTGWTKTFAAGDIFWFQVTGTPATVTNVAVMISTTK